LTGYEITNDTGSLSRWATWAIVLKEVSHVLLVSYSAFNPLAYCGGLLLRTTKLYWKKFISRCSEFLDSYGIQLGLCRTSHACISEIEMMKSVGITLNGADPIHQQLQELDAQSR